MVLGVVLGCLGVFTRTGFLGSRSLREEKDRCRDLDRPLLIVGCSDYKLVREDSGVMYKFWRLVINPSIIWSRFLSKIK
jgi:hypothetical protein